jgi:hypothetical protein
VFSSNVHSSQVESFGTTSFVTLAPEGREGGREALLLGFCWEARIFGTEAPLWTGLTGSASAAASFADGSSVTAASAAAVAGFSCSADCAAAAAGGGSGSVGTISAVVGCASAADCGSAVASVSAADSTIASAACFLFSAATAGSPSASGAASAAASGTAAVSECVGCVVSSWVGVGLARLHRSICVPEHVFSSFVSTSQFI